MNTDPGRSRETSFLRDRLLEVLNQYSGTDVQLSVHLNYLISEVGADAAVELFHILACQRLDRVVALDTWEAVYSAYSDHLSSAFHGDVQRHLLGFVLDVLSAGPAQTLLQPKLVEIRQYDHMIKSCRYDSLTGLCNRGYFEDVLSVEISRARRYGKFVSMVFFDLDHFKDINDSFGHPFGDVILKRVSQILQREKRQEDIAARYGGEELVVIMPETDKSDSLALGERIRLAVASESFVFKGQRVPVTISGGVATYPEDSRLPDELVQCADAALYDAKRAGRNQLRLYRNRRRYPRLAFDNEIQVCVDGLGMPRKEQVKSKNVSPEGILFKAHYPYQVGSRIRMRIPMQEGYGLTELIGRVVRQQPLPDGGCDIGLSVQPHAVRAGDAFAVFLEKTFDTFVN